MLLYLEFPFDSVEIRIQHCYCCNSGHSCGMGFIPGPGTSASGAVNTPPPKKKPTTLVAKCGGWEWVKWVKVIKRYKSFCCTLKTNIILYVD